ncbi:hypothetical protein R5R35_000282 [Gryllus longicercus]|uniref:CHK kinase-like domain-containing protein n=1 Tax=Gryllus longicercus TaxID=2509291 RepID=A0AAN9YW58_9ORTH
MSETRELKGLTKDDLQDLLKGKFGPGVNVTDCTSRNATAAGENYGSSLFLLTVNILNNNVHQIHHIIAKLLPPTQFLREVFNVDVTFEKEINLYKLVYPAYLEMQQECGLEKHEIVNLVPPFYGARISPMRSSITDFDAVLLMGNLKVQNYQIADRLSGLDLKHCELVMQSLASFHALGVALREKKPVIFKETVLKTTTHFHIGVKGEDEVQERKTFMETLVKNVPECRCYFEKMIKHFESHLKVENKSLAKEPFATVVHNDLWTNNMLFKYEEGSQNRSLLDMKLLDFQVTLFCSPVRDIIFFLYSSAQKEVVENYYDHLINIYYESFVNLLKKLKCDIERFSKTAFLEEINTFAPTQLFHTLFMLAVIYAQDDETEDLHELTSKDHMFEVGRTEVCRRKIISIIQDFERKGWIREKCEL